MNTLVSRARLAGLGATAGLALALSSACGAQTAEAPGQDNVTVVDQPRDPGHPAGRARCSDAPDIVLRRTRQDTTACREPLRSGGYLGANGQPPS